MEVVQEPSIWIGLTYETWNLIISFASLLLSIVTFGLGYVAYKKFLRNELKTSQLEEVISFTKSLQNTEFDLARAVGNNGEYGYGYSKSTAFGYAGWNMKNANNELFILYSQQWYYEPFKFLNSPLLPNSISSKLLKIKESFERYVVDIKEYDDFYFLIQKDTDNIYEKQTGNRYKGGIGQFIKDCHDLRKKVLDWLKKHGINDINQSIYYPESPFQI